MLIHDSADDNVLLQIQWLLTDEIASALRLTVPVTAETLKMVAGHVKASSKADNLSNLYEQVYLKFVYGPEQSLTHFIEVCVMSGNVP